MDIGFIGIGVMGQPMALNLARSGQRLVVWNRTPEKCAALKEAGATVAFSPADVFKQAHAIILMMADESSMDLVLGRGSPAFQANVADRMIIHMGTTAPEYSLRLRNDIEAAGGTYVEAPVSGSRKPAEAGQLVSMVAGREEMVERVRSIIQPMCQETFACGPVPRALQMKLAVNLFLITMVTGLAEAAHFAERHDLDLEKFRAILDAGPMASSVSRVKAAKLVANDFEVQASILNVLMNNRLVAEAARASKVSSPLLDVCHALYGEAATLGHGYLDMAAVVHAIRARTDSKTSRDPWQANIGGTAATV